MKHLYKINAGQVTRFASRKVKRAAKKGFSKCFRKASKAAVKEGAYDLAPVYGKYHGWAG